ncbi:MAG: MarR family winged helix-turn-helix transcriptional regulator [Planctomycetota bacterium]|nr:MarR family winged helix-turn-helix transcriptional regulator [Planctomycetota bacterium]
MAAKRQDQVGPECACFNIRRAARAITQFYDEVLRPTGLGANQLSLLTVVSHHGPLTVNRLAEAALMDRTTVTRNLKPLANQDLLRIYPGEDRREREVSLTRKGKGVLTRAYPLWKRAQARMMKGLGPQRFGRLVDDLSAVVKTAQLR